MPPGEGADTTHLTVGRRQGQRRRHHADHQQPVRRALHRAGARHDPEQLHVELRPAAGQCAVDRAGQAGHHSMAPMIALRDGKPLYALGLPGGLRIFPSAMQALINLLDHGMSLQEAVEAPRLWTAGRRCSRSSTASPTRCAGRCATRPRDAGVPTCRRRHERDPVRRRRQHDRRRLLARRRHADRVGWRLGSTGRALRAAELSFASGSISPGRHEWSRRCHCNCPRRGIIETQGQDAGGLFQRPRPFLFACTGIQRRRPPPAPARLDQRLRVRLAAMSERVRISRWHS